MVANDSKPGFTLCIYKGDNFPLFKWRTELYGIENEIFISLILQSLLLILFSWLS